MKSRARTSGIIRVIACTLAAEAYLILLGPPATARADDMLRARLIGPTTQDELLQEALAMVKGELSAAGFRVTVLSEIDANQTNSSIAPVVAQDTGSAVVVVRRQPPDFSQGDALEFWVYEPWGKQTAVVRALVDVNEPSLSARRGAVQTVEVLRAALAQRAIARKVTAESQPPSRVNADDSKPVRRDQATRLGSVRVSVGIVLWSGFEGLGSSLTPIAALSVTPADLLSSRDLALDLRVSAAGLGWPSKHKFDEGTITVRQSSIIGDLVLRLWPLQFAQPLISIGGGAYAISIDAEAVAPFVARSPNTWSGIFGIGSGLLLAFSEHFAASLEAQLFSATAPSDVSVAGRVEAVAGAPVLLTGAQLTGVF